jgi:TolA-binding protein
MDEPRRPSPPPVGDEERRPPVERQERAPTVETVEREQRLVTEDELPATIGQFKSLRRWLIVTGIWAVAATAIAVFALIQANEQDEAGREEAKGELGRVQRQLNGRIDDLEQRVDGLPTSKDVSNLDGRLSKVEDDVAQATEDVGRLSGRVDDLEGRVDELEGRVDELEQTATTTTETTP